MFFFRVEVSSVYHVYSIIIFVLLHRILLPVMTVILTCLNQELILPKQKVYKSFLLNYVRGNFRVKMIFVINLYNNI